MKLNSKPERMRVTMAARKISRSMVLGLAFLVLTLSIVGAGALSTYNYYQFYPALAKLDLKLADLKLVLLHDEEFNATATYILENPTGYRGLFMIAFQPTYWSVAGNGTASLTTGLPTPNVRGPLNPGVPMTIRIIFTAYKEADDRGARIVSRIDIVLSTFLDTHESFLAIYQCASAPALGPTDGPGTCEQSAVTFQGVGGGGIGGGR